MLVSMTCVHKPRVRRSPDISPAKLERMPESLEMRYALSAAPPHCRDGATTYVLDPSKGYLLHHRGTNGVSCIVVRSDCNGPTSRSENICWPVCFDAEGLKDTATRLYYTAELRARAWTQSRYILRLRKNLEAKITQTLREPACLYDRSVMRGWTSGQSRDHEHASLYVLCSGRHGRRHRWQAFSLYPFMLRMSRVATTSSSCSWARRRRRRFSRNQRIYSPIFAPIGNYLCTTAATRSSDAKQLAFPSRIHRTLRNLSVAQSTR